MREILFRGKRKDNGEWVYGVPITDKATNDAYIITSTAGASLKSEINNMCATGFRIIRNTVGQYTGLTDKNGTRIFEGDIVKTSHGGSTYYAKIEWGDGCFWVTNHDIQMPSYISEVSKTYLEVIGNVHDNPELLKGD